MENLVKKHIEKINLISPEKLIDSSCHIGGDEWEIYQEDDKTLLYVFYDLIGMGIGYACCARIKCERMKYNIELFQYAINFSNISSGEWEDCDSKTKDSLLCNAMERLNIYDR